jgi:cobalt-zinc-cadmium efflux system membrane fusion protein
LAPTILAVVALVGLAAVGQRVGWKLPKFSALTGGQEAVETDWCEEHSVPEPACVECHPNLMPKGKQYGWCRQHGVHECPLCNPGVAQLSGQPRGPAEDWRRADEALAFAPRAENGRTCRQQLRRIQFASDEVFRRLDIGTAPAKLGPVTEAVTATGELDLDPTRVARLSPRATGTVRALFKQVGEHVRAGELVAVVEAADVGRAKAELLQALGSLGLREQTLVRLKEAAGRTVTEQAVLDAEAARAETETRVLAARQALTNLGLPVDSEPLRALAPDEAAGRLRRLGLPDGWPAGGTASNNLLPVRSPIDGEVIERPAAEGEPAEPTRILAVVADTRQMWLTLNVRLEDADRVRPGQPVRFRHEGHDAGDVGTVAWVSPAADEKTRTVPVRVAWPNENGRHHARTFGTAQIVLRHADAALVAPSSAVHWEGCCHVVFVRDRDFETSPYKVFHVRKVRPGAVDAALNGPVTEIAAGLLPGEVVATTNSGILRSELLKNDLGAG